MISSLVEPGGARPGDATRRVVILTMLSYTALAAIFAGAASIGAGLAVLALGMLFTLLIDMRQWRDIVDHDRRHAPSDPRRVALPSRETPRAIEAPAPRPLRVVTTTRLLPYGMVEEPASVAALAEPMDVAVAPEPESRPSATAAPEPEPKPAPKPRRQPRKPKKA